MPGRLTAPASLDERSLDRLLEQLDGAAGGDGLVVDLEGVEFVDPYGMVGLLEVGHVLAGRGQKPGLRLPRSGDVLRYLARMGFFRHSEAIFQDTLAPPLPGAPFGRSEGSDVLLEITRIQDSQDIHAIIGRVKQRAHTILATHLRYDERAVHGFIVSLSEVCQNIVEHSEASGYVGIQKYFYQRRLGANVVKIAVMDLGVGIRASLAPRLAARFGSAWGDRVAVEQALLHGASRFAEAGRGQGLANVRRFVQEWQGKLAIRSGTARVAVVPAWDHEAPATRFRRAFPGTQISIVLPELRLPRPRLF